MIVLRKTVKKKPHASSDTRGFFYVSSRKSYLFTNFVVTLFLPSLRRRK